MVTQDFQKFCPVCKLANDANATICRYCGAPLNKDAPEAPTTRRVDKAFELTEEIKEQITKTYPPPTQGLLLFLLNSSEPIGLCLEPEFILGRGGGVTSTPIFDLTEFNAFAMGVSRNHAMIKAVKDKYILTDFGSSNGTWLNGERLLPNKPHDLPSEGVIQLGRLQLIVTYSRLPTSK
jgi:hypothetical protein